MVENHRLFGFRPFYVPLKTRVVSADRVMAVDVNPPCFPTDVRDLDGDGCEMGIMFMGEASGVVLDSQVWTGKTDLVSVDLFKRAERAWPKYNALALKNKDPEQFKSICEKFPVIVGAI